MNNDYRQIPRHVLKCKRKFEDIRTIEQLIKCNQSRSFSSKRGVTSLMIVRALAMQDSPSKKQKFPKTSVLFSVIGMINCEKRRIELGWIDWHNAMNNWTYFDWSCLILSIAMKCNLPNIVWINFPIKLFKCPNIFDVNKITEHMQHEIDLLLTNNEQFMNFFRRGAFLMISDNYLNDIACRFDMSTKVIDRIHRRFGVTIENRSKNPAFTYYHGKQNDIFVVDHKNIAFVSQAQYITWRLVTAWNKQFIWDENDCSVQKYKMAINQIVDVLQARIVPALDDGTVDESDWELPQKQLKAIRQHYRYVYPRKMRSLGIKYGFVVNRKHWKFCENCQKIHGFCYNGIKCIIKCCKCRKCYVCSKQCQKIMWKKGHKIDCDRRKRTR